MVVAVQKILLVCLLPLFSLTALAAPIYWSENGHQYQLIKARYTWEQANQAVEDGWHLATITSAEEQSFIQNAFADYKGEFWLGGFQADQLDPIASAADDWQWVTGEVWDYSYFKQGEPNEWRGKLENGLGIWNNGRNWNWQWNDEHGRSNIKGYIVEKSVVPEPATLALLFIGTIGLVAARRHNARA